MKIHTSRWRHLWCYVFGAEMQRYWEPSWLTLRCNRCGYCRPGWRFVIVLALVGGVAGCTPVLIRRASNTLHFHAGYSPTPGDEMAPALLELTARLETWGLTIRDLPPDVVSQWGRADLRGRVIEIDPDLSINARFEVLAHEAGHYFQPAGLEYNAVGQVIAESIGVCVQQHYGSKTALDVGARYLAGLKEALYAERYFRREIEYGCLTLTGRLPLPEWRDTK